MSFVLEQVQRIDAQLNRVQLSQINNTINASSQHEQQRLKPTARVFALQAAIRGLSPGSSERSGSVKIGAVRGFLSTLSAKGEVGAQVEEEVDVDGGGEESKKDGYEQELEWLLVSKATTQVYGHVLNGILAEAVRLSDDIWYWDEVLGSQQYTALYSIQTSPLRLWDWGSKVWEDVKERGGNFTFRGAGQDAQDNLTQRWREFYGLVRQVVREKSVREVHKQMLSPVTRARAEIRAKQNALKKVRIRNANALGVLLGEGLANECVHGEALSAAVQSENDSQEKWARWKSAIKHNVALMEAVLAKINDLETPVEKFDANIAELTDDDPLYNVDSQNASLPPEAVAERLSRVLVLGLNHYETSTKALVREHGKPSRLVRYWLPFSLAILSSSTILRIMASRQAEILQWIQDLGATAIDFWQNWVVEPTRNVIRTIRHDEGSEISIMSKRSLEGDRESLERMVVDFAIDNPANATGSASPLTDSDIATIRTKVAEGDLTPVLKAYEKDLTSPFMGAVRGNLIRALLIQIQKTKVDVEVAMGGIDALLKSQELLIGFISLTPGLLLTYALAHYLRSTLSTKRGSRAERKHGKMVRQLRNIDRILAGASPTEYGELLYKDQGLLLCEVHVLRQGARRVMSGEVLREFGEECEELCDVRVGVERQRRCVERIRWAYGRWLS